jgi:hypothetical protein
MGGHHDQMYKGCASNSEDPKGNKKGNLPPYYNHVDRENQAEEDKTGIVSLLDIEEHLPSYKKGIEEKT